MSSRMTRAARLLAAGTLLVGGIGVVPAAQAAHPHAAVKYAIGVSVPFLELKELADGIQRGVQLAVNRANASNKIPGVSFTVMPLDDTVNGKHDGAKDAQNARQFINDGTVIGAVGPLNSSAAKVSMPVYNQSGLVLISPSNTNPDLTAAKFRAKYEPTSARTSSPITYFRTCTTDAYQGPAGALYAKKAGFKSVFVTDNQGTYGIGLAAAFKAEATKIGLKVLGSAELDAGNIASSAQSLATTIASAKPDLVYFGGEYGAKGGAEILADSLRKAGLTKVVFMGGDGILASDFIAGSSAGGAQGALATTVGGDPNKDPNAKQFIKEFNKTYAGKPIEAYDTYSYDAASIIINGFAKAVADGKIKVGDKLTKTSRLEIAKAVAATQDFKGATGPISFDKNGDTSNHAIGVYKATGAGKTGKWSFLALAPQV